MENNKCAYTMQGSCSISRAKDVLIKMKEDENQKLKDLLKECLKGMPEKYSVAHHIEGIIYRENELYKQIQEAVK